MSNQQESSEKKTAVATLGNGCFWCTEAVFQRLKGVIKVSSGYAGGQTEHPDYKSVCSGQTGHAECLWIEYDPQVLSFPDLLEVFFATHDPTTLNRQGNDVGTQYRSVIFYHDEDQKRVAAAYIDQLNQSKVFPGPIVTTLEPYTEFYPAENYHHDYYNLNQGAPYCRFVIRPKLEKFNEYFAGKLIS